MSTAFIFTGFILVLLIYIVIARKAQKSSLKIKNPNIFFLTNEQYNNEQYSAVQTGYFLQMATIYPFFIFSYYGMAWLAIWNTLFYAVGIVLLIYAIPYFQKRSTSLVGSTKTLHAYIASIHEQPYLRKITAWLSLIGFVGLAVFEIVWGARILKVLFNDNNVYYFTIAILAVYLILYLWIGGQKATFNTSLYQIVIAYIGLHAAVTWVILNPSVNMSSFGPIGIIMPIIVLLSGVMFFSKLKNAKHLTWQLTLPILISLLILVISIISRKNFYDFSYVSNIPDYVYDLFKNKANLLPLLAFSILPIFFQFVDMTNWQRMVAVKSINETKFKKIQNGLKQFLLESPLSWLFPVVLGLSAIQIIGSNVDSDPWDLFLSSIFSGSTPVNIFVSMLIVAGITSIFLSTADGLMMAVGYSYSNDLNKKSMKMIDNFDGNKEWKSDKNILYVINQGRIAISVSLLIVVFSFIVADILLQKGQTLIGIFLAFFTPMVSFSPSILIPTITGYRAKGIFSLMSIVIASILGISGGLYSLISNDEQWQYIPIILAVSISWFIYLLGILVKKQKLA